MESVPEYDIKKGYIPGAIGRIAELHGTYYHKHWKFGLQFESKVAVELSEFLQRYNKNSDGMWVAAGADRIEGSIVVDGIHGASEGAHLRWFIVSDTLRKRGVGENLVRSAVEFCRVRGYPKIYLWTFEGLDSARRLYEKAGFQLIKQQRGDQWGTTVNEQYFECNL